MSHLLDALFKLPFPFRGKPRIASLLSATTVQLDELEEVFAEINEQRDVETADRRRLEILADLIGQRSRPGDTEVFRRLIIARGFANTSNGTTATLRDLHRQLFGEVGAVFALFPPKYLQIRQPMSSLPTSTEMTSIEIVQAYIDVLQACADPSLLIEIVFEEIPSTEFPSAIDAHEHSLGMAIRL